MTRDEILAEMGISPIWRLRDRTPVGAGAAAEPGAGSEAESETEAGGAVAARVPGDLSGDFAAEAADAAAVEPSRAAADDDFRVGRIAGMGWDDLREGVAACRACGLCEKRTQAVLGVGDPAAEWLFVGEGPGAEEDLKGEPFVGQAGKLLDAMLAAIDLKRGENVYIGNAVKCRPPGNRTPEAAEITACLPFLERQIALIRPKLIVLLGRAAVQAVLGEERSLAALRGRRHEYRGIPVVVTYHPAYLLRNMPDKAKAWEDLCFARRVWHEARLEKAAAGPI